ncbi:hypothetical protein K438DRAFT_1813354 [Mycena galopus ATCC 62051]|nr:hypothetical protein K438DRAFT_1813354 [Mycena galopus ATCC 62051]
MLIADPQNPDPTRPSSRSTRAGGQARAMEAEYNAVTCVAAYMLLMSLIMRRRGSRDSSSSAAIKLPAQYDGPKSWLDPLISGSALLLSRTAARKERSSR